MRTYNRLDVFNALESNDRINGLSLKKISLPYSVNSWRIDEDVSYPSGINHLVLAVNELNGLSVGDPVTISGISESDVDSYSPSISDPNPASLNNTYFVESINEVFPGEFDIHLETSLSWSDGEISASTTAASIYQLYKHKWICSGGYISLSTDVVDVKSSYSINVVPNGTGPVTLSLYGGFPMLIGDNGKSFSFNAKIFCNQLTYVSCLLTHSESIGTQPVTSTIYPGRFSALRSNVEELPLSNDETYNFYIDITISNHEGTQFYFTLPHLIDDMLFMENPYVLGSRKSMPDFYWEMDSSQVNPSFPLFRFIDCLTSGASGVQDEYKNIYKYEPGQLALLSDQYTSNETHSTLVTPQYVSNRYAPWLSQFNGHKLKQNISYYYNGITDTSYDSPQKLFESSGSIEAFIRWQIATGYYGRASGTTQAIREAAKQVLHFTKNGEQSLYFVSITPHYQSDPFKILIQTLVNETFDCSTNGQESYAILDAVEMAKPMGYKIYHQAVTSVEFRVGDRLGTYPLGSTVD